MASLSLDFNFGEVERRDYDYSMGLAGRFKYCISNLDYGAGIKGSLATYSFSIIIMRQSLK